MSIMRYQISLAILLLGLGNFAVGQNIITWTGAGTSGDWSDVNNWDTYFDSAQLNYANIDAVGYAPRIDGVTTGKYAAVRCGYTADDPTLTGITITSGQLRTLQTAGGDSSNGYIAIGFNQGTKTYLNLSGGLISGSALLLPREGSCQANITGGSIVLSNYIRMGEQTGHGGGTVNMTSGLIRIYNSSSTDRYLGIGYESGKTCTFNLSGTATLNTQRIAVSQYGDGRFKY